MLPVTTKDLKREETQRSQLTFINEDGARQAGRKSSLASEVLPSNATSNTTWLRILAGFLCQEIDQNAARLPLAIFCFLSGFIGCISFSACSVWVGYQTGNTVQSAIALSRLAYDPASALHAFRASDYQALCSVVSFAVAAQIGGRLCPWSLKSRAWITVSMLLQLILTILSAIFIYLCNEPTFSLSREHPSWHNAYGYLALSCMSASMGLQGVLGESLGTGFTATVVLTSIYCQLALLPSPRKWSLPRDDRIAAIALFCVGGFISRLILVKINPAGTLAVAAGIRFTLLPLFMLCRSSESKLVLPVSALRTKLGSRKGSMLDLRTNDSRVTVVEEEEESRSASLEKRPSPDSSRG